MRWTGPKVITIALQELLWEASAHCSKHRVLISLGSLECSILNYLANVAHIVTCHVVVPGVWGCGHLGCNFTGSCVITYAELSPDITADCCKHTIFKFLQLQSVQTALL
jgi:hypothetical protein